MKVSSLLITFIVKLTYGKSEVQGVQNRYRYMEVNPSNGRSKFGFISMQDGLGEEGFVSTEDINGNHVLISDFESQGYQCTGSCYCEGNENRISVGLTARNLFYLVAASSAVVATGLARKHFQEECVNEMSTSDCPLHSSVVSGIVDCRKVTSQGNEEEEEGDKEDKKGRVFKSFECMGNCLRNQHYSEFNERFKKVKETVFPNTKISDHDSSELNTMVEKLQNDECVGMMLQQYVNWREFLDELNDDVWDSMAGNEEKEAEFTELFFSQYYLRPFCRFNSRHKVDFQDKQIIDAMIDEYGERAIEFSLCKESNEEYPINPTVKCVVDMEEGRIQPARYYSNDYGEDVHTVQ